MRKRNPVSKKFYIMVFVFIVIIISTITFRSFIKEAFIHDPSLNKNNINQNLK